MEKFGIIEKVSGPLIIARNMSDCKVYDVVRVGKEKLIGEIIELRGDKASIQVYEETAGIGPDELVYFTGMPLSVVLGPGLIGNIYDGIERPLKAIAAQFGSFIKRGVDVSKLDLEKEYEFTPLVKVGDVIEGGTIIGSVPESLSITHKIMVPPNIKGKVTKIEKGKKKVKDIICILDDNGVISELKMYQEWPVRIGRPYKTKLAPNIPMTTGQRVIDTMFPITLGGVASVPGPFGSGKTVVQHQLAKWSDCDIVVYIGCGERGNEMTDVLMEFPELQDPKTGNSLMERTVLIANTSNMPVAAREASIYTGITIAEYYRDMGYKVAVMADSTSRWAEALREMSSRLEEMPGEEGYPAYLGSRIAQFYERAGLVVNLNKTNGSVTAIGAISPPGGDTAEPVSQATLRIVKIFWNLSASLAYKRHFPAIDWLKSYSLYDEEVLKYYDNHGYPEWSKNVISFRKLLQNEASLLEIVQLVGVDTLSIPDRIVLMIAQIIREDFLHQNAFDSIDTFTSTKKQYYLASIILHLYEKLLELSDVIKSYSLIESLDVYEEIGRFKYSLEEECQATYLSLIDKIDQIVAEGKIKWQ